MNLQVLLVEDDADYMAALKRDLPDVFKGYGVVADLHPVATFQEANAMIEDPSRRFDLILSDTYKGDHSKHEAAVLEMVKKYRAGRFCPLVVFSASSQPPELTTGAFVMWADKASAQGIQKVIGQMLSTKVPQIARNLHEQLDRLAGNYLWEFLDKNWDRLVTGGHVEGDSLVRLIRRRAALQLAEINYTETGPQHIAEVSGHEIYVYPPLNEAHFSLGEVIRKKADANDIRVILTPHCYLAIQTGQAAPRANFVVTVKTVPIAGVIGTDLDKTKRESNTAKQHDTIRRWITPPPNVGKPAGRYWYLPHFLDVPDLYCDFLQVESLPHDKIDEDYVPIAVLAPPFAESLQACYGTFHGAVGIPNVRPDSVASGFLK